MKNKKGISLIFVVGVMLFLYSISVIATEPKKGSIEIVLTDGKAGTSKENVVFEYAKVADVINGQYQLLDDYGEMDLNNIKYSVELEKTAEKLSEKVKAEGKVITDKEGKATISDLETGLYLLRVGDQAEYESVVSALIAVPTWNEEQKEMNFDVTVTPKHSPASEEVRTGDDSNTFLWTACMLSSCVFVVLMVLYHKEEIDKSRK